MLTHDFWQLLLFTSDALQKKAQQEDEDDDERFQDPDNETGLFASAPYEEDDEEADKIYEAIDSKMDERRKARRFVITYIHIYLLFAI